MISSRLLLAGCTVLAGCSEAQPSPIRTLEPDGYPSWFTMAPAGDVDGDGIQDLVLGDMDDSRGGRYAGLVRLVSGRDFHTLWERSGDEPEEYLGNRVFGVGDLDGDGIPDVAVTRGIYERHSQALVLMSGKDGASIPVQFPPVFYVAPLGDVDHDGRCDLLMTVDTSEGVNPDEGRSACGRIEARSGRDGSLLWATDGPRTFRMIGDLDGDGADEFIAYSESPSLRRGSNGEQFMDLGAFGTEARWANGELLAGSPGDQDGDGRQDLLVLDDWSGRLRGQIVSGRDHRPILNIEEQDGVWWLLDAKVACIGDVDRCGKPDWVLGAPSFETWVGEAEDCGGLLIVSGKSGKRLKLLRGEGFHSEFARSIAALGDVDGDGVPDVACTEQVWIERLHASATVVHVYSGADLR